MENRYGKGSGIEKRMYPRCPIVSQKATCVSLRKTIVGNAINVSRGGLFVSTEDDCGPGEVFEVEFSLPGDYGKMYKCKAEVVWWRAPNPEKGLAPGFGLKFLNMPEKDAQRIDFWVENILKRMNF